MKKEKYFSEEIYNALHQIYRKFNDDKTVHYSIKLKGYNDWTVPLLVTDERIKSIATNKFVELIAVFSLLGVNEGHEYTIVVDSGKAKEILKGTSLAIP